MRPSDKILSDLDEWTSRTAAESGDRRRAALANLLGRSLRGLPGTLLAGITERWADLARRADGAARARAWLDASCLLALMDYDDDPPLDREDWTEIRELFSEEAESLDIDLLSYVMERVLEHGGF